MSLRLGEWPSRSVSSTAKLLGLQLFEPVWQLRRLFDKSLRFLRRERGLDVYLNELTGEEVSVGLNREVVWEV